MKILRIKKEPEIIYVPVSDNTSSSLDYWLVFAGAIAGASVLWFVLVVFGMIIPQ